MSNPYQPTIPAIIRTATYIVGLVTTFLSLLTIGLAPLIAPEHAVKIITATGVIGNAVGWLCSAFGVAYRPTSTAARYEDYIAREAAARHQTTGEE